MQKGELSASSNPMQDQGFGSSINDTTTTPLYTINGKSSTSDNNNDDRYKKNAVDGDREYDLCLVLKNKTVEEKCVFNIIIRKLSDAGLVLYIYPSALQFDENKERHIQNVKATFQRDTMTFDQDSNFDENTLIFILIRATVKNLKEFADENDFKMLLDAQLLKNIVEKGVDPPKIKPFSIPYPNFGEDVFITSAIPVERGCCPISCGTLTKRLTKEEKDLIPYGKRCYYIFLNYSNSM